MFRKLDIDLVRFKAWRFVSSYDETGAKYDETTANMTKRDEDTYNEKI